VNLERVAGCIRAIPDYPKPGIVFRDITTLLGDGPAFRECVEAIVERWRGERPDFVAGLEARGFIVGGAVAAMLGVGFVPIRKKGKLPHRTVRAKYALEYGVDELEVHVDAVSTGQRVLLVDDLIATGGTALAALDVLGQLGAKVIGAAFIIDLPDLGGGAKLEQRAIARQCLVAFSGH